MCEMCDIVERKIPSKKIYEDSDMLAVLSNEPACIGHTLLIAKKHIPLITQVEDPVIAKMFGMSQQLAGMLFESFNAEGTNVIIQNGGPAGQMHAHFLINILPRFKNDGLSFEWPQKQIPEEKMTQIQQMLSTQEEQIKPAVKVPEPVVIEEKQEIIVPKHDNYLYRQLRRIP